MITMILLNTVTSINSITTVVLTADGDFNIGKVLIVSIVIGLICGLITAFSLKGQLTSVYKRDSASNYTRPNSFKLAHQKDIFLGSKTETVEKPKEDNK